MPKRTLPEPRSWLTQDTPASHFGRNDEVAWRTGTTPTERALIAAARQQHDTALRARTRKRAVGITTETLAGRLDITVDQLRRLLRGEAHLTLADSYLILEHLRTRPTPPTGGHP